MYFAALKTNGKIIIFKLGANFVRLAGVLGEAMVAPGPVSQRDTVEYVNFLLIVGRMTLPQYWRHLNNLLDGTVLVHVDEVKDGEEVVPVGIALPVAFGLDQRLLDARDQRFMSLHYDLP